MRAYDVTVYRLNDSYERMHMIARLVAAGTALSVTLSLVWAMATLGYPPSAKAAPVVLAQVCR
jgi:multisubunit Na+/H+ antiporter MnhG subunit